MSKQGYPESSAIKTWAKDDIVYSIVGFKKPIIGLYYCGYCRFPKRPLREPGYDGIVTYVPVHGGITYAKEDEDGSMVYGFDCAHDGDEHKAEVRNLDWLAGECERMAEAIKIAAKYEDAFLLAPDNETTAKVLDEYHAELRQKGIVFKLTDNFGAMIQVLSGNLK